MNPLHILREKFAQWFSKTAKYPENTKQQYSIVIKNYLAYLETFKIFSLKDVSVDTLQKFTHFNGEKEYAQSFVNLRLASLNLFYSWAYQNRYCNKNLITEYKKNKLNKAQSLKKVRAVQSSSVICLTSREQQLLIDSNINSEFNEIRNKAITLLILTTGIFSEELINLTIDDLNIVKNILIIDQDNARERTISLDSKECINVLQQWLKLRKLLDQTQIPYLFFTKGFAPISRRLLHQIVSGCMHNAGIKKSRAYPEALRQTAICNMFANGLSLEEIQKITGIKTLVNINKYRIVTND